MMMIMDEKHPGINAKNIYFVMYLCPPENKLPIPDIITLLLHYVIVCEYEDQRRINIS